jgi:uncharacterized protein
LRPWPAANRQWLSREWKPGQALGKSMLKPLPITDQAAACTQVIQASFNGCFPARPEIHPGVTTCNNRCGNSTCYRT